MKHSKRKTYVVSGMLQKSWHGEVVAGRDRVRKLNAFEEYFLA